MSSFCYSSYTIALILILSYQISFAGDLLWPIGCKPGDDSCHAALGYPDTDGNGIAYNCEQPGYLGHHGTDISLTSWDKMDEGVPVYAAADGEVVLVFDSKYDRCPDPRNPDCQPPPDGWLVAGQSNGYRVCTEAGNYCNTGDCCCYWCFDGANVIILKHAGIEGVFATRYDHLKKDSILASPGDTVTAGQKIAEVGSAGNSSSPHLHFEVWGNGFYDLVDPWAGPCGSNSSTPLWKYETPWEAPTTATTIPPNADAGTDELLTPCENLILNGENSTAPDGTIISYAWTITSSSSQSAPTLEETGSIVSLPPVTSGTYTITLTVSDEKGATDSDEKIVVVKEHNEWDVNKDCKQGLEEVIHILNSITNQ